MQRPALLPTSITEERFAGIVYHLDGELVPTLTVELTPENTIFFEHHTLLWKNTGVHIGIRAMKGAIKRMLAGFEVYMAQASGVGQISLSRDGVGHIFPIHLAPGQELQVREHQFLAATGNLEFSFARVRGISNLLIGGTGFFVDKFVAHHDNGIVWLHGYGNVFEKVLAKGEQIDVEPGAWLYKDPSVKMSSIITRLSTGLFAGYSMTMQRFTGPGKLGIQSMSLQLLSK